MLAKIERWEELRAALVQDSSSVNEITRAYSALHQASFHGNVDIVRLLLKNGANPHLKTKETVPQTALEIAEINGHANVVRLLRQLPNP